MVEFYQGQYNDLSLYVRQAAWLSAVPVVKSDKPQISRRESLKKKGIEPEMPECDSLFMVAYLCDVGPLIGNNALTHGEIEAWMRNTGVELDSWQARTLRQLSLDYLGELRQAANPDRPAPFDADYVRAIPSQKVETMRDAIRGLANL